jgi:hypothetical protein
MASTAAAAAQRQRPAVSAHHATARGMRCGTAQLAELRVSGRLCQGVGKQAKKLPNCEQRKAMHSLRHTHLAVSVHGLVAHSASAGRCTSQLAEGMVRRWQSGCLAQLCCRNGGSVDEGT